MHVELLPLTNYNASGSCSDELFALVKCICVISNIIFYNHCNLLSHEAHWYNDRTFRYIDGYNVLMGMSISIHSLIAGHIHMLPLIPLSPVALWVSDFPQLRGLSSLPPTIVTLPSLIGLLQESEEYKIICKCTTSV